MCPSGCQKLHNTLHLAGGNLCGPTAVGETGPRGWMGCRLPPWKEAIFLMLVSVVRDHWGLPELQVGLPGDKRGARQKVGQTVPGQGMPSLFPEPLWHFPLSTYCAPAAKQEAEAQRGRRAGHTVCLPRELRPDPRPSCFGTWLMVGGGDGA